jgi:hypothetical protein
MASLVVPERNGLFYFGGAGAKRYPAKIQLRLLMVARYCFLGCVKCAMDAIARRRIACR